MTLIPFDQRDGVIWLDGQMVNWRDARVHVLTHALHYGSSVFEGVRSYGGKIFKCEEHTDRLFTSATLLDMVPQHSKETINDACYEVLKANGLSNAYLRPVVWRGAEQMGIAGLATKVHTAIAAWDWGVSFPETVWEKGLVMKTAPWRRPPPECAPTAAKAAGLYMICTLSKRKAETEGYDDCLFLDWRGHVSEATAANIFFVMDGVIHTPNPDCFLNGITRQTIIDLAKQAGIEVVVRTIMPEEISKAQEVFLTGTAYEIIPVGKIDGHSYNVGPVTKTLRDAYYTLTGRV